MKKLKFRECKKSISNSSNKSKILKFSSVAGFTKDDLLKRAEKRNLIKIPTIDTVIKMSLEWIKDNTMYIPLPCLIVADFHIPHTSKEWLQLLCEISDIRKIKTLMIAGDFFDQDQFKIWMNTGVKVDWDTELQAGRELFECLLNQFEKIYFILGNHDIRIFRALGSIFDVKNLFYQLVPIDLVGVRVFPSNIKYAMTEDKNWIICHPSNYSKQTIKTPLDIIAIEHKNVICAHGHHFGSGNDQSGKYIGADCGGMFSQDSMTYNGSTVKSSHSKWKNGFVLINEKSDLKLYSDGYEW